MNSRADHSETGTVSISVRLRSSFDYGTINKHFTFACLATAPIVGSVSSFILNGGALWALFKVGSGAVVLSRDRGMIQLALPIYVYCAAYLVSLALNTSTVADWHYLPPVLTFLLFPFLYSSWSMSKKETIAKSTVAASIVGCYGALCLAAVQVYFFDIRAEGGAGNAIIFGTVTCLAASVCLAGFLSNSRFSALPLGAFISGTVAILYSGSRITWLALLIAAGTIFYIHRRRIGVWLSIRTAATAALVMAAVAIAGFDAISTRIAALTHDRDQLSLNENYNTSLGVHAKMWEIGIGLVRESPFVGHGPQSTRPLIEEGFRDKADFEATFSHFHNGFLTAFVETGIVGVLSLAAVFVVATFSAIHTLASDSGPAEKLGAQILIVTVSIYMTVGLTNILVGHDILDSTLMAFLVVGTFLSTGTSPLQHHSPSRPGV